MYRLFYNLMRIHFLLYHVRSILSIDSINFYAIYKKKPEYKPTLCQGTLSPDTPCQRVTPYGVGRCPKGRGYGALAFTLWKPNFHISLSLKGEKNMRSESKSATSLQKVQETMFLT